MGFAGKVGVLQDSGTFTGRDPMDALSSRWQEQLIALYCLICRQYTEHLWVHAARQSNHRCLAFSDEETLTVYLFGLLRCPGASLRDVHAFARDFLHDFFPRLPSYAAFDHRLGFLSGALQALTESLLGSLPQDPAGGATHLLDSMPIVLAQGVRAGRASVAAEVADMGYCASKKTFFWGVKLHALCLHVPGRLPRPEQLWVSAASESDLTLAKCHTADLPAGELYADKIYQDRAWKKQLAQEHHLALHTPVRRSRGAPPLDATDRLYSRAVCRVRQSVETFFAWIDQVSHIQHASRVRSSAGLWVHLFGRLAVALLCLLPFYP